MAKRKTNDEPDAPAEEAKEESSDLEKRIEALERRVLALESHFPKYAKE